MAAAMLAAALTACGEKNTDGGSKETASQASDAESSAVSESDASDTDVTSEDEDYGWRDVETVYDYGWKHVDDNEILEPFSFEIANGINFMLDDMSRTGMYPDSLRNGILTLVSLMYDNNDFDENNLPAEFEKNASRETVKFYGADFTVISSEKKQINGNDMIRYLGTCKYDERTTIFCAYATSLKKTGNVLAWLVMDYDRGDKPANAPKNYDNRQELINYHADKMAQSFTLEPEEQ